MKSYKYYVVLLCTSLILVSCIGCRNKIQEKEATTDLVTSEVTPTDSVTLDSENPTEIDIDDSCTIVTQEIADQIAKEVKEIIIDTQEGIYRIENFSMTFNNQKEKEDDIYTDLTVEADWTLIRKPEDDPIIIGMQQVIDELKTEEEKEKAKVVMSGFLAEMTPYNTMERIQDNFKIRFSKNDPSSYETLVAYSWDDEDTPMYPMKEYYDDNYKENWDDRIKLGRSGLLDNLD